MLTSTRIATVSFIAAASLFGLGGLTLAGWLRWAVTRGLDYRHPCWRSV
jgi:hypothetical protein